MNVKSNQGLLYNYQYFFFSYLERWLISLYSFPNFVKSQITWLGIFLFTSFMQRPGFVYVSSFYLGFSFWQYLLCRHCNFDQKWSDLRLTLRKQLMGDEDRKVCKWESSEKWNISLNSFYRPAFRLSFCFEILIYINKQFNRLMKKI